MRTHQEMDGTVAAGEEGDPLKQKRALKAQCGVLKKKVANS